jgi:uncharacterized membrane protein (UPF0127 family)
MSVVALAACSGASGGGVDDGFPRAEIAVGGETWAVAVADTPALRARGLQGVAGLGELDGMLFVFPGPSESAFTMRGTLMAIDIAFFGGDGALVGVVEMVPCGAEPCPTYRAPGPYRYALETEPGGFAGIGGLELDPTTLPGSGS